MVTNLQQQQQQKRERERSLSMAPPGKLSMRDDRARQAGRQQKQVTHNNASDYYAMKACVSGAFFSSLVAVEPSSSLSLSFCCHRLTLGILLLNGRLFFCPYNSARTRPMLNPTASTRSDVLGFLLMAHGMRSTTISIPYY
jgi:hypothetical protein